MLVFFPTTGPWIKYTECISGSAEFLPSGGSREESDIISGWCNSLHQSVDSASQPPGRAPAGCGSRGSRQWSPDLFPHGEPLSQKGVFHRHRPFFPPSSSSNTSQAFTLIVFSFLPVARHHDRDIYFFNAGPRRPLSIPVNLCLWQQEQQVWKSCGNKKRQEEKKAKTSCGTCWVYSQGKQQHFDSVLEGKGCREECEERVHHSVKDPGR